MRTRLISTLAISTLVLAACGGDDGGDQQGAADLLRELAAEQNVEFDDECLDDLAGQLSDEDAAAIVEAGPDGDADISPEGEALGERVFNECVDVASFLDSVLADFEDDETIDIDCLREELADAETVEEVTTQAFDAAFACTTG